MFFKCELVLGSCFEESLFLSLDFRELRHSVMSICLFTEVKQQWAAVVMGWVTASCTPCVSDGFVAHTSRLKLLLALLLFVLSSSWVEQLLYITCHTIA